MCSRGPSRAANSKVNHMTKRSKNSTSSSETSKRSEPEWVVADDGESSAEPRVEREHVAEPELDVVQHAPDEPTWSPVEPQDASEVACASDEPAAKPARPQRKTRAQVATKVPAPTVAQGPDAATPVAQRAEHATSTEPVAKRKPIARTKITKSPSTPPAEPSAPHAAAESKGTLAEERVGEVATAAMKPKAAAPATAKQKLERFVAERAEQHAGERVDDAPRPASAPVAKRKHGKPASEAPQQTPPVVEPEPALPSEPVAGAAPDAPTEPTSTLPSMEAYIAELATMSVQQLTKRHVEVLGKAPRIKNATWLRRKIAWHEQVKRFGGLSVAAKRRLEALMGELELPAPTSRKAKSDSPAPRSTDSMPLGTRLERTYRGRVVCAVKVEDGWDVDGATYKSLSAAAKSITGSHCSGNAFFKLWQAKGGAR
jgi:hypothetical protein